MKTLAVILLSAVAAHAAEWINISDAVTSKVKPGYAGTTAGVVADPASGDVFMVVNDQGLWKSSDGGATWKDLEKGFSGCGLFDRKTFVATKAKEKGVFRSDDAGATWAKVSESNPVAATPVVYRGAGYWSDGTEVLVSKDKGATWSPISPNRDKQYSIIFGPLFGKTAEHFVVVGKGGFLET